MILHDPELGEFSKVCDPRLFQILRIAVHHQVETKLFKLFVVQQISFFKTFVSLSAKETFRKRNLLFSFQIVAYNVFF